MVKPRGQTSINRFCKGPFPSTPRPLSPWRVMWKSPHNKPIQYRVVVVQALLGQVSSNGIPCTYNGEWGCYHLTLFYPEVAFPVFTKRRRKQHRQRLFPAQTIINGSFKLCDVVRTFPRFVPFYKKKELHIGLLWSVRRI